MLQRGRQTLSLDLNWVISPQLKRRLCLIFSVTAFVSLLDQLYSLVLEINSSEIDEDESKDNQETQNGDAAESPRAKPKTTYSKVEKPLSCIQ